MEHSTFFTLSRLLSSDTSRKDFRVWGLCTRTASLAVLHTCTGLLAGPRLLHLAPPSSIFQPPVLPAENLLCPQPHTPQPMQLTASQTFSVIAYPVLILPSLWVAKAWEHLAEGQATHRFRIFTDHRSTEGHCTAPVPHLWASCPYWGSCAVWYISSGNILTVTSGTTGLCRQKPVMLTNLQRLGWSSPAKTFWPPMQAVLVPETHHSALLPSADYPRRLCKDF